jgi:beta-glucosidase/6-phospho-beta-glucosidase/beta-galactosidase
MAKANSKAAAKAKSHTARAASFLDSVRRSTHIDKSAHDSAGKTHGHDGSGLPSGVGCNFMFATGVECSAPTIKNKRVRRDLLEECGHYERFREDLQLVVDLGLRVLRYGLPIHRIYLAPGKYDWSFADEAMGEIRRLDITPILDLLHFGVPDWLGDFQNPELPGRFAEYAAAVAERYSWVRYYTLVNEIYVTACNSARLGLWNEELKSDEAFVTALKNSIAANLLATKAIVHERPDAIIVQAESAEYTHQAVTPPDPEIALTNKLRLVSLDLLYARPPDAEVCHYLMDNGLTREEYDWFMENDAPGYQIMGNDYYGRNERILLPDGTLCHAEDVLGWYQITRDYYNRYKKPVMHTETNTFDADENSTWLWKQWINILRMRADGVPVLGFTWYSLTDQVDWDIALAEKRGRINECGLYDLERRPRKVAHAYRSLLEQFGQITIVPHGEMFDIAERPARLKVEV